jgi:C4-type Zn-finger protein
MPTKYDHSKCPVCASSDIEAKEMEIPDGASTYQPCECHNCGATWNDVWALVGYDNLVRGIKAK